MKKKILFFVMLSVVSGSYAAEDLFAIASGLVKSGGGVAFTVGANLDQAKKPQEFFVGPDELEREAAWQALQKAGFQACLATIVEKHYDPSDFQMHIHADRKARDKRSRPSYARVAARRKSSSRVRHFVARVRAAEELKKATRVERVKVDERVEKNSRSVASRAVAVLLQRTMKKSSL